MHSTTFKATESRKRYAPTAKTRDSILARIAAATLCRIGLHITEHSENDDTSRYLDAQGQSRSIEIHTCRCCAVQQRRAPGFHSR